jgi:hypothetical protein
MSSTVQDQGQGLNQQQKQGLKAGVIAASDSAINVWAGLTEVERTSLLVAFARWATTSLQVCIIIHKG